MKHLKTTLLASTLALGALGTTAATAGDFDGFYLGIYGSGDVSTAPYTWGFGGNAGYLYEFVPGGYAGVEADIYRPSGGPTIYTGAARLGYDFNSPVMAYASVGAGMDGTGTALYTLGAGAQYDIGNGVSVRAGVDRYQAFSGGPANYVGKIGVAYTF